jgi:WD40 repeat protein
MADVSAIECGVIGDVAHISEPVWSRDSDRCLALSWLPDQPHCLAAASGIKVPSPQPPTLNKLYRIPDMIQVRLTLLQTIKLYDIRVKSVSQGSGAVPTISSGSTMVISPCPSRHLFAITLSQVTKLAVCAQQPRWLASCSDDGIIKVWDVAMPNEPIVSAATGSKTVTDISFHPQRRGTAHAAFCHLPQIVTKI